MPLIPTENLVDWEPGVSTGVSGGIPTNRTNTINVVTEYSADNTGATNTRTALQNAINAAATNDIVYLPAGTYRIDSSLDISHSKQITLRGAGVTETIIDARCDRAVNIGTGDSWGPPFGYDTADITISAGLSKGSTTVTIGDAAGFVVGQIFRITVNSDPDIPILNVYNYNNLQMQVVQLVSKTGTTLTFDPPLYEDYGAGTRTAIALSPVNNFTAANIGVEDLTVDSNNYTTNGGAYAGFYCENIRDCWWLRVGLKNQLNYPISWTYGMNLEVRQCVIEEPKAGGSNIAGILVNFVSASLIEDNIITDVIPSIEVNFGSSGNAISRNYMTASGFCVDTNHAPHNAYNLYEANYASNLISDGYFGGASRDTVYRNVWTGTMSLKRFTRGYAVVGNFMPTDVQFGYPNIGNTDSNGTAQLSLGDPWVDWDTGNDRPRVWTGTLTTRTSDSAGTITLDTGMAASLADHKTNAANDYVGLGDATSPVVLYANFATLGVISGDTVPITGATGTLPAQDSAIYLYPSPDGFQEIDLDVEATTTLKGNRYTDDNSFDPLGGDTLVDSLMYDAKPTWMTTWESEYSTTFNLAAFDPVTPTTPEETMIPAGYRFINGPPSEGVTTITVANVTNFNIL